MSRSVPFVFVALLLIVFVAGTAGAETKLFVPHFAYGPNEDAQFLLVNGNNHESAVDLWAFTGKGELLGQFQFTLKGQSTRTLRLSEAFQLSGSPLTGWLGVVSPDDGIHLSYSLIGDGLDTTENSALSPHQWISKESQLTVKDAANQSLNLSNPNSFAAQVTVTALDRNGRFLAVRDMTMPAFGQIKSGVAELLGDSAAAVKIWSSADVISTVDAVTAIQRRSPPRGVGFTREAQMDLMIQTEQALGAYQVTLEFNPELVEFDSNDVLGGSGEGFGSRPLVINVDQAAGRLTIASLQVGALPTGRFSVARLKMTGSPDASPTFTIRLDSAASETGANLKAADVALGLVRVR